MIAIFSKFDMAGGSERRCVELANGIQKHTPHHAYILAEKGFPDSLNKLVDDGVTVVPDALTKSAHFVEAACVIVVNTDCREFSTIDYWNGKSHRHSTPVPIVNIKKMMFLYNFLVSPSQHLHEIAKFTDVGIITTNRKFFDEITKQDRYERVRMLPRYILGSPINPETIKTRVRTNAKIFGCHSKRLGSKWNPDWPKLEEKITRRYPLAEFRFMGMKDAIAKGMKGSCLKENEKPVADFLDELDVFVFFPEYKREEPWARVIAEAMIAGLPIVALNRGGTSDQVLTWNNGILCKKFDDYHKAIVYLIEHPKVIETMSRNSIRISNEFHTENVIKKLMEIV